MNRQALAIAIILLFYAPVLALTLPAAVKPSSQSEHIQFKANLSRQIESASYDRQTFKRQSLQSVNYAHSQAHYQYSPTYAQETRLYFNKTLRKLQNATDLTENSLIQSTQFVIYKMSSLINILKRLLVLAALLFLIQNLINYWILASSYYMLQIYIPEFVRDIIGKIYEQYNNSFLDYLGFEVAFPELPSSNIDLADPYSASFQFNVLSFSLEPLALGVLTLLQLFILTAIIKHIKKIFRKKREQHINQIIQIEKNKRNKLNVESRTLVRGKQKAGQIVEPIGDNRIANIFQSEEIRHQQNVQKGPTKTSSKPTAFLLDVAQKIFEMQVKSQLNDKRSKHWSESIRINKLQKIGALIINYMCSLLLPAFSLLIGNGIINIKERVNLIGFYFLLGFILVYPFLYIATLIINRGQKNNQKIKRTHRKSKAKQVIGKLKQQTIVKALLKENVSVQREKTIANSLTQDKSEEKKQRKDKHRQKPSALSTKSKPTVLLKNQEIQTILQYYINFFMSISLGIRGYPVVFFVTTTTVLSLYLVFGFISSGPSVSCKTLSFGKVNSIIHKLTFWLYNCVFFAMFYLSGYLNLPNLSEEQTHNLNISFYYLGIAGLALFILGGMHQLLQFFIQSAFTVFQVMFMLYSIVRSHSYEAEMDQPLYNESGIRGGQQEKQKGLLQKHNLSRIDQKQEQNDQGAVQISQCQNVFGRGKSNQSYESKNSSAQQRLKEQILLEQLRQVRNLQRMRKIIRQDSDK